MLLSLWFFVVLVGLAVTAPSALVALHIRRQRSRRTLGLVADPWRVALARTAGVLLTAALVLAAVADGFDRHYSYIPTLQALLGDVSPDLAHGHTALVAATAPRAPSAVPRNGVDEHVLIPGAVSGVPTRDAYVYLPAAYFDPSAANHRFPVLYLLHGSPGIAIDWIRGGYADRTMDKLVRDRAAVPFIIVMPDVNGGYRRDLECQDIPGGPQDETYLVKDVVAWVDAQYRTVATPAARAVGGLSTGGYCGINLTFRHQDVFSAAVSHSGYGRPDHNLYTGNLFGADWRRRAANTPDDYLATIRIAPSVGVYLDAGIGDDQSRRDGRRLYDVLRSRGVAVTLNIVPGESHNFVAWRKNLSLSLPWVSRWFVAHEMSSATGVVAEPSDAYLPPPSASDAARLPPTSRPMAPSRPLR
jgi:enterochelin esterase-like enzyme